MKNETTEPVNAANAASSGSEADRDRNSENSVVFSPDAKKIIVSKPVLTESDGMVVLSAEVSGGVNGTCFFSTEAANRDFVDSATSNCFLIGLLYTAMYEGCDLELEGAISEKLLFETKHYLMPMLAGFFDKYLKQVNVKAAQLISDANQDAAAVGTGFSGGVDSFHTIREFYLDYDGPAADKVDTLLFFNVGSHGMGRTRERLAWLEQKFRERMKALGRYANDLGLPFVVVDSNVFAFIRSGHLETSSLVSCAAALFLGRKLRVYYFASMGASYHELFYSGHHSTSIAQIDDYLLPHVRTETFAAASGGSACSRVRKTMAICDDPLVQKYLNVCNDHDTIAKNCSTCFKCQRTLLTLDILGVIDKFSNAFDLSKFDRKARSRYIATVLNDRKKDPLLQDICNFAEERHYDLRAKTTLFTRLYMRFTETDLFLKLRSVLKRG